MRKDKEKAFKLRRSGKSYKELKEKLGVPKSTLSGWFSSCGWSQNIKQALNMQARKQHTIRIIALDKIRGERLKKVYEDAENEAKEDFKNLKYHPLFISGVMLYWGEGDRVTKYGIRFANVDPHMIRLFVNFLLYICQIPRNRLRTSLLLYPDLNDQECKRFWVSKGGIPGESFQKSVYIEGRHKKHRLQYGVCSVIFSSTYFKVKMMAWIDLFRRELLTEEYYKYSFRK